MITIDFETEAIEGNPTVKAPAPVGFSIKYDNQPSMYHAWGHPTENTTTYEVARQLLGNAFDSGADLLFHNAKFDLSVAGQHMGIAPPAPLRVHDTQYDIFITDPYSPNLSLKPSSERILNLPPDEQDELRAWILANVPEAKRKPSSWGGYICRAPAGLVGRYARGDTDRTMQLFTHLHPQVIANGMERAYQREQLLLPILTRSEQRGIRLDIERLQADSVRYEAALSEATYRICTRLGRQFNVDSAEELADALEAGGFVDGWDLTDKGNRSTARPALQRHMSDHELLGLLSYHGAVSTALNTFIKGWLAQGAFYGDGRLHTEWNSVRQARGEKGKSAGTRTGRLSSEKPNFQNVPNEFAQTVPGLPALPVLRGYLLPEEGHVWLSRDYSSQEMRILAHFTGGKLYNAYKEDPTVDAHKAVGKIILEKLGQDLPRKYIKITGFGILYGEGTGSCAVRMGVSYAQGLELREAYFAALPEVEGISRHTKRLGKAGECIVTWGGRQYYSEPARLIKGRLVDFSYKLLNYLIQGSAADCTKQSIINWDATSEGSEFMATVHDENNISAPADNWQHHMKLLEEAMADVPFDVPMLSDGEWGPNWGALAPCP